MKKIFLIEDHDEALKIWRKERVKNLDLVHIDAHIDFGFYQAKPIGQVFEQARSIKELKQGLELAIAFKSYVNDFDKQANIGNYIYPAMNEGIVKDFYWVIPGGVKEFNESKKNMMGIIRGITKIKGESLNFKAGVVTANLLGRKFIICILEKLPVLKQKVLLDIDTDFLVIDSLKNSDNIVNIGKRRPWIMPESLAGQLKKKIKNPECLIIAYSVNGGYTPMSYRYLGDELAYYFSPQMFHQRLRKSLKARNYFNIFRLKGNKEDYWRAARLDSAYRGKDNNYGPLYLAAQKFNAAKNEFLHILSVDPEHPFCSDGLGRICLQRRAFKQAKKYFSLIKRPDASMVFGLAKVEYGLGNFRRAKVLLFTYKKDKPLDPHGYYFLARIFEKERKFLQAARFYQDAMRLGINTVWILEKLLKITYLIEENSDIINFVNEKLLVFKKVFLGKAKAGLKRRNNKVWLKDKEKLLTIGEKIKEIKNAGKFSFKEK